MSFVNVLAIIAAVSICFVVIMSVCITAIVRKYEYGRKETQENKKYSEFISKYGENPVLM